MKTKTKIGGYIVRSAAYAVLFSLALIALTSAFNSPNEWHKSSGASEAYKVTATVVSQPKALSFAERVAYQRAIEDVYWRHRIWPKENPVPKPSLNAVMPQAQLETKVRGYLHDSLVLEDYWQKPITAEELQGEMNRMARDTQQPEALRELFEALGNDPAVIAECLARPILAERLIVDFSAQDQIRHVESLQTEALRATSVATTSGQLVYTLPKIADAGDPPCTDNTWTATTTANAPLGRYGHTAVWTGSEMIVWGGDGDGGAFDTGRKYNPSTDSWTATSLINAPIAREFHTAVWTGSEMIVWGGYFYDGTYHLLNTGGRYNPSTNSWTGTSTTNAPTGRQGHTAVWTGSEMIVWGGSPDFNHGLDTGGRYNPSTNTWTASSTTNAPTGRSDHTAVWTGSEMIVWGGYADPNPFSNTGGRYNPSTNTWTATSTSNAPTGRYYHTAVWTGGEMIVWGGGGGGAASPLQIPLRTGGRYNPSTDSWIATSTTNAPDGRFPPTAVWTGSEMIIWGGEFAPNTGGRYHPSTNSWRTTSTTNAPTARWFHTAIWTGSEMIVWGGQDNNNAFNTGGRFCAQPRPTPTPTASPSPTVTATATPTATFTPTPTPTPTPFVWPSITPRPLPTYPPRPTRPPR